MTKVRPPARPKKLLLASLSIAVLMGISFVFNAGGLWAIPFVLLGIAAMFGYVFSLASCRPTGERWVFVPAMLIFFASGVLANIGGHSVWLTAFGETLHCNVISIETHLARTSPTTYSSKLRCGDRETSSSPTTYQSVQKPGATTDIVVDRTGFAGNLEPGKVTLWRNLLLPLAVLMNAAFISFVARRPVRAPAPTAEEGS